MCETAPGCLLVVLAAHADENLAVSWIDNGALRRARQKLERDKFRELIGLILQGEKLISIVDNRRPYGAIDFNRAAMWAAELRPRQKEVLRLIGRGLKDREIANAMGLCEPTVRHHVRATKAALQLTTRTKTALCANWLDAKGLLSHTFIARRLASKNNAALTARRCFFVAARSLRIAPDFWMIAVDQTATFSATSTNSGISSKFM